MALVVAGSNPVPHPKEGRSVMPKHDKHENSVVCIEVFQLAKQSTIESINSRLKEECIKTSEIINIETVMRPGGAFSSRHTVWVNVCKACVKNRKLKKKGSES